MGFKFRKSKKILPGVKLNFSNKGMGVSFGGKHARYSISPTGRRTASIKVAPGLTYTTSSKKAVKMRFSLFKKKKLLKLQKLLISNSPNKLIQNERQLMEMAQAKASNHLKIFKDSILIVTETADPDTFFERYNLILQHSEKIGELSDYVKIKGVKPKSICQEVLNDKQNQIHQMIARYWDKTVNDAAALKTENGKKKRYQKFFDTLERYKGEMSEENIAYYTGKFMFPPL